MNNIVPVSCTLNKEFADKMRAPIRQVWNAIAADLCDMEEEMDNETAIECCLDADRITMFTDDKEAMPAFREQVKVHGYTRVLKFLSKHIRLY